MSQETHDQNLHHHVQQTHGCWILWCRLPVFIIRSNTTVRMLGHSLPSLCDCVPADGETGHFCVLAQVVGVAASLFSPWPLASSCLLTAAWRMRRHLGPKRPHAAKGTASLGFLSLEWVRGVLSCIIIHGNVVPLTAGTESLTHTWLQISRRSR